MPSYSYKAINDKGRRLSGSIMADNELDLEARLKHVGLDLIEYREAREKKKSARGKVSIKDLIILCMHLEQLDRAGVPLHDALADVRDSSESPRLRDVLTGVYESVRNGTVLSKALEAYPRVFNEVFVGLVAAGEKTGKLSESFVHLADHLKWTAEIRSKIKKATRYPMVLLVVISGVISVMMLAVVPKLVDFIISQGFSLPLHTRALIATSHAFENYWYLILGIPIATFVTIMFLYRTSDSSAYKIDAVVMRVPLIGNVTRKIDMARFTHFFSVMFTSGIDVLQSLSSAKEVVHNRVLKESIDLVTTNVTEGNSLTFFLTPFQPVSQSGDTHVQGRGRQRKHDRSARKRKLLLPSRSQRCQKVDSMVERYPADIDGGHGRADFLDHRRRLPDLTLY